MLNVFLQMTGLMVCGVAWQYIKPAGITAEQARKVLTTLVYNLLLPALVLSILWNTHLDESSLWIAVLAATSVLLGLMSGGIICRLCQVDPKKTGAIILAASFPNVTYLGLPVLESTFGAWSRSIAIQYDMFACTPLLFTVGILIAARMGGQSANARQMMDQLFRIPPVWAAVLALVLNFLNIPLVEPLKGFLELLERGVVPLMLFSLGLSLQLKLITVRVLPLIFPVVLFRLLLIPLIIAWLVSLVDLNPQVANAITLEAAMPSMVLGIVICDQYDLDVSLYAAAVAITTILAMFTLPMWYSWLV